MGVPFHVATKVPFLVAISIVPLPTCFDPPIRTRDMPVTTTGMVSGLTALRRGDGMSPKALASLGSRSPRMVSHGRQPASRVLRCAPVFRMTAAADRAGSPCGPAERLARDRLPASATPAIRSAVAEHRRHPPDGITCTFPGASGGQGHPDTKSYGRGSGSGSTIPARCASKQVPSRSIAQATFSRRSATERRARACPWPRARSAWYLPWLTGSR